MFRSFEFCLPTKSTTVPSSPKWFQEVKGGDDLRKLPLSMRKTNLERLLRGRPDGIFVNPFEAGAIGPDLFRAACNMGLEGLVSKRSDRPYRGADQRTGSSSRTKAIPQ